MINKYFNKTYYKSATSFYDLVKNDLLNSNKRFIVTANPETFMHGVNDSEFNDVLCSDKTTIIPDGIGIVKGAKKLNIKIEERIPGVELVEELLKIANEESKSLYFLGSKEEVCVSFIKVLESKYPNINLIGYTNGYVKDKESKLVEVSKLSSDIVLVALGVPAQEKMIFNNLDHFTKGVFVGVGGSIDVLSGHKKRAPKIFIRFNLEWLYRILKEPKRIVRFVKGNIKYFFEIRKIKNEKKIKPDLLLLIAFVLIIVGLLLITILRPEKDISVLENRKLNNFEKLTYTGFLKGTFQTNTEEALLDQFPMSQTLKSHYNDYSSFLFTSTRKLLLNVSDDYKMWPVGSGVVEYIPTGHLFTRKRDLNDFLSKIDKRIIEYNLISNIDDNISVYVILFDRGDFLTSSGNAQGIVDDFFIENLNSNIKYSSFKLDSIEAYTKYYFKNDYHWNHLGQYKGYEIFMDLVFPERDKLIPKETILLNNTKFIGSTARRIGDKSRYDKLYAFSFDLGTYSATENGKSTINRLGLKGLNIDLNFTPNVWANQYNEVYGYNLGEIVYDFSNDRKENALVFVDSFSNPINELIAYEFNTSYFVDLRYFERQTGKKFEFLDYISEKNISHVIFMGNAGFYIDGDFQIR